MLLVVKIQITTETFTTFGQSRNQQHRPHASIIERRPQTQPPVAGAKTTVWERRTDGHGTGATAAMRIMTSQPAVHQRTVPSLGPLASCSLALLTIVAVPESCLGFSANHGHGNALCVIVSR